MGQVFLVWPESVVMPKPEDVVLRWSDAGVFHAAGQPGIVGTGRQWVYVVGDTSNPVKTNNLVLTARGTGMAPETFGIPEVEIPSC